MNAFTRRNFIQTSVGAAGAVVLAPWALQGAENKPAPAGAKQPFKLSIIFGDEADKRSPADIAPGYDTCEIPGEILVLPLGNTAHWNEMKKTLASWALPPITAASHFISFEQPFIGPQADLELATFWSKRMLTRLSEIGVKVGGIWGQFFAVPEGFPKNKAIDQTIQFLNIVADHAKEVGVTVALEPNAHAETLFPTYMDGVEFARRINRPEIKVMADLNYFIKLNEPMEDIAKYPEYCVHAHIAAKNGNQPGVDDAADIHAHFFRVLRDINYTGSVSVASGWAASKEGAFDYKYETAKTLKYLKDLRDKVYADK